MLARKRRLAAAVFGLVLAGALLGWLVRPAPPRYTVTDLDTLPGDTVSNASGLNNRGEVVGLSGSGRLDTRHSFLYRDGVMTDLGLFGLIGSHDGPAINDGGQITGVLRAVRAPQRGFHADAFLYSGGRMRDLGTLPGCSLSIGNGINGQGQIVGNAMMGGSVVEHAFLYSGGRMTDIGTLPGYAGALPTGINAVGQIVGYSEPRSMFGIQAFVYDSRTRKMTALATPPGFTNSLAFGVNDQGQIIGGAVGSAVSFSDERGHALLWAGGRVTDLGTLPGLDSASGAAINNRGVAVGTAWSRPNRLSQLVNDHPIRLKPLLPLFEPRMTSRAFVYSGGRMQNLNELIPARSGWTLEKATGINDRGQIVGQGLHHGQERAFLLTPVR
jgi:probable HAF family extracellular repeat protein